MRREYERSQSIVTSESSDHGRSPCIAVVEDDRLVRQAWCEAVTAEGYEVLEAADGRELFSRLQQARPKLILLDMLLPNVDGFEILARLRADVEWRDVPVLVVSELSETWRRPSMPRAHTGSASRASCRSPFRSTRSSATWRASSETPVRSPSGGGRRSPPERLPDRGDPGPYSDSPRRRARSHRGVAETSAR
jgi:CheY-like chemotaxis protein